MSGRRSRSIRQRARGVWILGTGIFIAISGFVLGRKWPIETITNIFAKEKTLATSPGWQEFARTDMPRYEMMRVAVGSKLLVFGGFYTPDTKASSRAESLDLATGRWSKLAEMPVALTHATPVIVRDTVWIAGGFEGNHPGPASARVWRYAISSNAWSEGPSLPEPRGGGALVAVAETLHYFGGFQADRNSNSSDHWRLIPGANAWTSAEPMASPRGHMSSLLLQSQIYAFGGSDGHDPTPIDVALIHRFDAVQNSWTPVNPLPFAISHVEPSTVSYEGMALIVGGRSRATGRENTDDVLLFEPARERWTHLGRTPKKMLGGLAAMRGDTLFAGLGAAVGNNPENLTIWRRALRNEWWTGDSLPVALGEVSAGVIGEKLYVVGQGSRSTLEYDIARGEWTAVLDATRPAPGNHHAAEVVNGNLALIGGIGGFSEGIVQFFDPRTRTWRIGPSMPFAAGASASAVIGKRVYVAGGLVKNSTTALTAVLDLESSTWKLLAPMPRPRNHAASATDGKKLYVFGGRGPGSGDSNVVANGFDDVQIYDPETDRWTISVASDASPRRLPVARGGMGKAVYLEGEFWVVGGETLSGNGATAMGTYARVDIYDPVKNSWREGPPLRVSRHGIFPVTHEGMIFVAGGGDAAGHSMSTTLEILWPRRP